MDGPYLLLGAHYDSVPGTPGADDNGSAVAVCLECARLIKQNDIGSTMIVFFNREEDGLLGSSEFVAHVEGQSDWTIEESHIFEMVGFCNRAPHSQAMPPGLPGVAAPDVGDFLALIANQHSNAIAEKLITARRKLTFLSLRFWRSRSTWESRGTSDTCTEVTMRRSGVRAFHRSCGPIRPSFAIRIIIARLTRRTRLIMNLFLR